MDDNPLNHSLIAVRDTKCVSRNVQFKESRALVTLNIHSTIRSLELELFLCTEIPDLYSVEADSLLSFRYSTIFLCIDMWNHGPRRSLADYIRLPQPYLSSAIYKEIPLQVAQSLKMKSFRSALKTTLGELLKEKKKEENKQEEQKEQKIEEGPLLIIELKVDMHCEGCARKVRKALTGLEGVEDVEMDVQSHRVIVKGKSVDPVKVCEIVQKKSGRKTELISPLPNKESEENKPAEGAEPPVVTAVLKVHMHCDRCAEKVTKVMMKTKGVQGAEADLKEQKVTVKGAIDPLNLVNQLYKRTGKHAQVVAQEKEEENKSGDGDKKDGEKTDDKKDGEEDDKKGEGEGEDEGESRKNESNAPKYVIEYVHPPQIFSDENPNSCSIM